MGYGTRLLQDA